MKKWRKLKNHSLYSFLTCFARGFLTFLIRKIRRFLSIFSIFYQAFFLHKVPRIFSRISLAARLGYRGGGTNGELKRVFFFHFDCKMGKKSGFFGVFLAFFSIFRLWRFSGCPLNKTELRRGFAVIDYPFFPLFCPPLLFFYFFFEAGNKNLT